MKKTLFVILATIAVATVALLLTPIGSALAGIQIPFFETEPDIPTMLANGKANVTKEEFLEERANAHGLLRGLGNGDSVDPQMRIAAVKDLEEKQERQQRMPESAYSQALLANWTEIGPAPIISGTARYSGRVISIVRGSR